MRIEKSPCCRGVLHTPSTEPLRVGEKGKRVKGGKGISVGERCLLWGLEGTLVEGVDILCRKRQALREETWDTRSER
jgi:hypothetical protein